MASYSKYMEIVKVKLLCTRCGMEYIYVHFPDVIKKIKSEGCVKCAGDLHELSCTTDD